MATKARLHWFWRGAIASAAAVGVAVLMELELVPGYSLFRDWVWYLAKFLGVPARQYSGVALSLTFAFPSVLAALTVYGLLTCRPGTGHADGELHCRRCNHILRSLSEPRCPECGEAI